MKSFESFGRPGRVGVYRTAGVAVRRPPEFR